MASVKMGVGRAALGVVFAVSLVATTGGTAHAVELGESSAFGASASLGTVSVPEVAKSAFPGGPRSADLATVELPGIGSINALSTTATAYPPTLSTDATARTAEVSADLGPATVEADAVTASCSAGPGRATGSATVTNGAATTPLGIGDVTFPANPAPNTELALPSGLGTVTLNEQISNPDGSLTVNAIHVEVASSSPLAGDLVIASTTCKAGVDDIDEGEVINEAVDENGDPLSGVAFQIKAKDGGADPSCTTDDSGTCTSPLLVPGTYEVCVTDVPDGYSLPSPRCKDVAVHWPSSMVRFEIPEENGKKKG